VEAPVLEPWQLRVDRARGALQDRLWALALEEGDADRVVPELEAAVRLDPLREDRVLLLAQAFAALGRTGEALAALDAHRRTVASELGLDPSLRVARLRQQLLAHPTPPVSVASGEGAAAGPAADTVVSPRRRPPRRVVAATVLGAAGVAALSWWVARRDEVPGVAGSALLEVDSSGRIAAVLDLPVTPSELAAAGSTVWVASAAARAVGSVDLRGARDLRVIGLDQPPSGVAAAGGSAVVGLGFSGDVVTVHGGRASAPRPAAPGAAGRVTLAAGPAGTWVATIDGEVHAPAGTSGWTTPVALERSPVRMSVDAGRAWVLASAPSELVALTSGSHSPVVSALRGEAVDVTSARGHAWVVTADENRLWHASPDDARVVGTTVLPGPPVAVAVLGDRVWVAVTDPPALVAHSWADLRQQASVALPRTPVCLAASDGNLVVAVN
jgi:hypothetical protein